MSNAFLNCLSSIDRQRRTCYEELAEDLLQPDSDVLIGMIHAETMQLFMQPWNTTCVTVRISRHFANHIRR